MSKFIEKKIFFSLAFILVFLFTAIMPISAFAADNDYTKYSSTYTYVTADDGVEAGTATVKSDDAAGAVDAIQIKLSLPSGVEFANKPVSVAGATYWKNFVTSADRDNYNFVKSDSRSITIKGGAAAVADWTAADTTEITFDFSDPFGLDIDRDFTGNIDATIEVWGLRGSSVVWSECDTVTIAKVAGSDDVLVSANPKTVSTGSFKRGADIKVYETKPGLLDTNEVVVFNIITNGVTFSDGSDNGGANDMNNWQDASFSIDSNNRGTVRITADDQIVYQPAKTSSIFPGDIVFTPIFNVDPDVTGEIKIRVSSAIAAIDNNGELIAGKSSNTISRATVVVATVTGTGARAKVEQLENNDTVVLSGQLAELDVSFKIVAEYGVTFKNGDTMTFRLNKGKFAADPNINTDQVILKRYDDNSAFYVYFNEDGVAEFMLNGFKIMLDSDIEPGDITLTIGGDYGDLGEVTIGIADVPLMVENIEPNNKATGTKINGHIKVIFNQIIKKGTKFNNIRIRDEKNNTVSAIVFIEGQNLIISPFNSLEYGTTYTVYIPSEAISNLVGNTLNSDLNFSFTTESNSSTSRGGSEDGGFSYAPETRSTNDVSDKVNALLKNAVRGDTITVHSDETKPQTINFAALKKVAEKGCNLSLSLKNAKVNMVFEPESLLVTEPKVEDDTLIEVSASIVKEVEHQDVENFALSVGGKILRAYDFNIRLKDTEKNIDKEIHILNGKATVVLDLSDIDLDEVNTELLTVVHRQPNGIWLEVESVFNPENKTLSFTTDSFSVYAVIERLEKEISMIKLTVGKAEAFVGDNLYILDVEPYVNKETNRVLVPLRFISEAMGANVTWDEAISAVLIEDGSNEVKLTIGSKNVSVNKDALVIDCEPELLPPGRICVPLRFVSETLGAEVSHDSNTKQIVIEIQ